MTASATEHSDGIPEEGREKWAEEALLRRATGFDYEEEHTEIREKDGEIMKVVKTVKKKMPPDVAALQFWLRNRHPEHWGDRKENGDIPAAAHFDEQDRLL